MRSAEESMSSSTSFLNMKLFDRSVSTAWAQASSWYRRELRAILPPETLAWLLDRGDRQLVLRAGEKELRFVDNAGAELAPISADELMASSLKEALARRGVTRDAVKIALEIERGAFLVRHFDVPAVAMANLPKLLVSDIERKTPFRASDVVYGHLCSVYPDSSHKAHVELWILRRDIIARALEGTAVEWDDLAVVRPQSAGGIGQKQPVIDLGGRTKTADKFHYLVIGLAAVTTLFVLVGLGATLWRSDQFGAELDAKIAEASARATRIRQVADRATAESRLLATLRQERETTPSFADLWEEMSRILPDGAYVTELRLTEARGGEHSIELVGFADSAVGLPALFDKSPIFSEAALTAAITPDAREKREGFSLRARVRQKSAAASK
jgi:general secretion pathway protein L